MSVRFGYRLGGEVGLGVGYCAFDLGSKVGGGGGDNFVQKWIKNCVFVFCLVLVLSVVISEPRILKSSKE